MRTPTKAEAIAIARDVRHWRRCQIAGCARCYDKDFEAGYSEPRATGREALQLAAFVLARFAPKKTRRPRGATR